MKIKTFQFKILSSCLDNDLYMKKQNAHDEYESLYTPEKIDNEINEFCKGKNIKDIKINEIYRSITNNNGTNIILLNYTILYTEFL